MKEEILEGTGIEDAPPLKGYARFEAKPSAETLLSIDPDKKDPLFVRWQYGLDALPFLPRCQEPLGRSMDGVAGFRSLLD